MRLSNRNKVGVFHFISTLVIVIFVGGVAAFLLEHYMFNFLGWSASLLLIIPLLFATIFYCRGRQIFEYDSDGEALNFKNRNVFRVLNKPLSDEFPKYKLVSYEFLNAIILKRLYITITSKKNHSLILKYDVSYLTKKELNDLKFSLSKVIRLNKEREQS